MFANVSKETIVRTVILFIALVNQVLTMFGKNPLPFSNEQLYEFLSTCLTVGAAVWAWWKNNSFTSAAIRADEFMKDLKLYDCEFCDDFEN